MSKTGDEFDEYGCNPDANTRLLWSNFSKAPSKADQFVIPALDRPVAFVIGNPFDMP